MASFHSLAFLHDKEAEGLQVVGMILRFLTGSARKPAAPVKTQPETKTLCLRHVGIPVPIEIIVTNAGRSSLSLPSPYESQAPMLGRPAS